MDQGNKIDTQFLSRHTIKRFMIKFFFQNEFTYPNYFASSNHLYIKFIQVQKRNPIILYLKLNLINNIISTLMTNHLPFLTLLVALLAIISLPQVQTVHPEAKYPFIDYCKYYKYPVEEHFVKTEDGYILRMFRIQKKNTVITAGLQPIIMQHGLLDSSDTFLINDEDKAPGFMLANEGYDVWFGNNRGNKHSRNHTSMNPDKDAKFWEFTFQHMADIDLPNFFKYVNSKTNFTKIHYIGHSQGSIQMHIALAKRNSVIENFLGKYFAFGPVAYVKYATSHIVTLLNDSPLLEWYKIRGIHEFMPSFGWFTTDAGVVFCSTFPKVCGDIMKQIMDADPSQDNYDRYDVLVGHAPAGTSVMNMRHWKQLYDSGKFQAYDFGSARDNEAAYGTPYPPSWDLGQIRQPMRLIAGNADELADLTDVNFLWDALKPEVKTFLRVYNAGHCTFMWGINVAPWMNDVKSMLRSNLRDE